MPHCIASSSPILDPLLSTQLRRQVYTTPGAEGQKMTTQYIAQWLLKTLSEALLTFMQQLLLSKLWSALAKEEVCLLPVSTDFLSMLHFAFRSAAAGFQRCSDDDGGGRNESDAPPLKEEMNEQSSLL